MLSRCPSPSSRVFTPASYIHSQQLRCLQVRATGNEVCERAEGSQLPQTCQSSCEKACNAALEQWAQQELAQSGFVLLDKDYQRLQAGCRRECSLDCTRPGKAYDFTIPFRK
jgi:hypothetical protein